MPGLIGKLTGLKKELPETLEAHKSREWIVMNLDAVKEFFGIGFKKPLFLLGH